MFDGGKQMGVYPLSCFIIVLARANYATTVSQITILLFWLFMNLIVIYYDKHMQCTIMLKGDSLVQSFACIILIPIALCSIHALILFTSMTSGIIPNR